MSAFNIGLSGLSAASKDLDVTSNNIANAETVGFKRSRSEFADVYATTAFGSTRTQAGSGVTVQAVTQQFNQGNLRFTENGLDMAISGQGFFVLRPNLSNQDAMYTRAGAFQVDKDGYLTNAAGQFLMGYPVNRADGSVTSSALASVQPIRIDQTAGNPQSTRNVFLGANLPADGVVPSGAPTSPGDIDPTDPGTYNNSTSVNIFDSQGNVHTMTYYFALLDPATNEWGVSVWINNPNDPAGQGTADTDGDGTDDISKLAEGVLTFDGAGVLDAAASDNPIDILGMDLGNGTDPMDLTLSFDDSTQYSAAFSVTNLSQDGLTVGRLSGLDISDTGVIWANYSNGTAEAITKVALANFDNVQAMRQLGDTNWAETLESGQPIGGEAGTGVFGLVKSGALEQSNVDLTAELVHLIVAQRNFQANAKSIETASRITETIINVR
jgi:flagellar hook protein FlgE